ncbi:MAG TPA: hypothetical protein PKV66_06585, partial [Candidatus Pelethenecus sp.]|nr:hypothetical protein [Candidatus Pelethenecus sp.]
VSMVIQVNGKLRDKLEVPADLDKDQIIKLALQSQRVQQFTEGHTIVKTIVVPKKLVNIVVKE